MTWITEKTFKCSGCGKTYTVPLALSPETLNIKAYNLGIDTAARCLESERYYNLEICAAAIRAHRMKDEPEICGDDRAMEDIIMEKTQNDNT